MTRASVLVLSHDRPMLLERSVSSALEQTVHDLEVLIVGDGVTDAVRTSAQRLASDSRVRFLDYPKAGNRGEVSRDAAIREADSNAIFYLCDDDLFMPTHVESLLDQLETHCFAQSSNCWVDHEGTLRPYPADLSSPETISWHLRDDVRHNAVSITGTAHRRDFYLTSGTPWAPTPQGFWPDHWQWRRLMTHPQFSAATSQHATALQFPHQLTPRADWSEQVRADELDRWLAVVRSPDGQALVDGLLLQTALTQAEQINYQLIEANQALDDVNRELAAVYTSRSWRLTAPLRQIVRLVTPRA